MPSIVQWTQSGQEMDAGKEKALIPYSIRAYLFGAAGRN
jgi:hypothetical protein